MNFVQDDAEGIYHTYLKNIESWLEIKLSDYDWHISDSEGGWITDNKPVWIKGEELEALINKRNYQFIWGIFSAFKKGTKPFISEEVYADGYDFWNPKQDKQLKHSIFEIGCFDSSATFFIGFPEQLEAKLIKNTPGLKKI